MKIVLIDAKYNGEIELDKKFLDYLKKQKFKTVGLYAAIQFIPGIENVVKALNKIGIKAISSRPERTFVKYQILGCDIYEGNLNLKEDVDAFLYIGDGLFHPRALVFLQRDRKDFKPVIIYDPTINRHSVLTQKDVSKILMKHKANRSRFLAADNIGVIVTMKPGQQHLHYHEKLKKKYPDKKFYVFVDDNVQFSKMENYSFIKAWVNTACPRIGFDDILNTRGAVVNASDV
jgi:2-(3-amino-3-carboxypropyl)histidine synthase